MDNEFLGRGWSFPVTTDASEAVELSAGVQDIEESIRIVLGTAKGERVMRPEFGCGIHEFTFAAIDTTTLSRIESTVESALREWEPRIEVLDVATDTSNLDAGQLDITVEYRVKATNDERNLVYPFYLDGGGS
ncbi:baseplate protein [Haloarcula sp. CBA1130]|uniref:GPW/gp25 family protein n=1 Tax=unclassified Haloarcula TaxID=2624677 RepID=UPI00124570A5|nr:MULTISPECIES: GPW/gp25 family protein [unclassified Haloarcula]KAA9396509.1 baseplate protein [Haloarcula sp. CBA1130]KAA9397634.1 baseplate protein [Haloarcula sp. CBA1129]